MLISTGGVLGANGRATRGFIHTYLNIRFISFLKRGAAAVLHKCRRVDAHLARNIPSTLVLASPIEREMLKSVYDTRQA